MDVPAVLEGLTVPQRTRKERYALMLAHRAAAQALEQDLKDEMAGSFVREGTRETWDLTGLGQVIGSVSHDAVEIIDKDTLIDWLNTNLPHQVHEVHRKEVINPGWLANVFLPGLIPVDPDDEVEEPAPGDTALLMTGDGTVVPGVQWRRGGGYVGASVRPDSSTVRRLKTAATAYALGAGDMPGLTSGESSARVIAGESRPREAVPGPEGGGGDGAPAGGGAP